MIDGIKRRIILNVWNFKSPEDNIYMTQIMTAELHI